MVSSNAQVNIKANLDISQAKGQINGLQAAFSKLSLPKGMENSFNKVFSKMKNDVSQIEALMKKGLTSKADVSSFNKLTNGIDKSYSKILTMIGQINSKEVSIKVDTTKLKNLENELEKTRQEYQNIVKNSFGSSKTDTFGGMLNSISKVSTSSKTLKANLENVKSALDVGDFSKVNNAVNNLISGFSKLGASTKGKLTDTLGLKNLKMEVDGTKTSLKELFNNWGSLDSKTKSRAMDLFNKGALEALLPLMNSLESETTEATAKMNNLNQAIASEKTSSIARAEVELKKYGQMAEQAAQIQQKANQQAQQGVMYQYDKQMQVNDLRMQVQYFFGLQNMIRLFRRGVSDAISTVKELDKAMTATAVVTDNSVSDMWGKLPEYTANANKLSTTIADMYNATTLYYQQGLDAEHAMGTAVETLKMARIAGIEGAEATDLMTAALRGFRMESNEANASHVNDVYSALAANSASNTYEIGTAMSKVASLASSANMDLETTATFLAQIIETTREAPETAGTALKTIIARFGEVKKLGENGLLTGTDEEGEVIDINKVDTALKTAGISLQDFINGNEGLDQVFLRLSEKWDTLSVAQQRYIATQAAGARMQARFIAMMQDYGRTQELLGIATNAEGAGEKQFAKTKESLEAKINELKNAYHQFIMGIADSGAIKTVVSALTKGFDIVNTIIQKVTGAVDHLNSGLGNVVQVALSLGAAFGALKIGGKILNSSVNLLGGLMLGKSATGGGLVSGGLAGARAVTFTKPILSKLDQLIAVTKVGNKNTANLAAKGMQASGIQTKGMGFLSARKEINQSVSGGTTVGTLTSDLEKYDAETQRMILATSPGTAHAIKGAYINAAKKADLGDAGILGAKSFINAQEKAFKTGQIDFKSYVKSAALASNKAFNEYMPSYSSAMQKGLAEGAFSNQQEATNWLVQSAIKEQDTRTLSSARQAFKDIYTSTDKNGKISLNPAGRALKQEGPEAIKKEMERLKKDYGFSFFGKGKDEPVQTTKLQNFSNTVSTTGAAISSAGMSLNQFSMQLSSMGADKAAAAVNGLGSAFTTVGMAATGAGSIVNSLLNDAGKLSKGGAIGLGITAIATTALIAYKAYQKHIQNIREEGKKVTKDYQKNVVDQRKSLKELNEGYEEYQKLRQGVDAKGNNLSLDEEQYQRYQDYTDKLVKTNKALQQGVNESGKAYISQSADIKKALQEESEEAKRAEDKYLTNESGQKIRNQISTYKRLKGLFNEGGEATREEVRHRGRAANNIGEDKTKISSNAGKFTKNALEIKGAIDELNISGTELKNLGLENIKWGDVDAFDAKKINDASNALSSYIANSDKLSEEQKEKASKSVEGLAKTYNDAVAASSDMTDWLEVYLSSTKMDGASVEKAISDRFNLKKLSNSEAEEHLTKFGQEQAASLTSGFREGLEQLTLQGLSEDWTEGEYKQQATKYAQSLKDLSSAATIEGQKYSEALTGIAEAQAKYDSNAAKGNQEKAAEKYRDSIRTQIEALDSLAAQYENKGDMGSQMLAESIRNGMQKAVLYTAEAGERIQENLNVLSGSFESANGALEKYQEQTKDLKDYYTAAEGMKTILSDIGWDDEKKQLTGKDVEGHGSQKFWLAAENLVDEKVLNKGIGATKAKIEELAPTLEEGQKGFDNFLNFLDKNKDKVKDWYKTDKNGRVKFEDLDDSSIKKMANQLGVADDYLSSMINKSRQFMNWNLSDKEGLLTGIKSSEGTIHGQSGKKDAYFYNYDQLKAEARAAGVTDFGKNSEFSRIVTQLQKEGVKLLNIDKLTSGDKIEQKEQKKMATDLIKSNVTGFKEGQKLSGENLQKAIEPLVKSGQYSAEDALSILQAAGAVGDKDKDVENFSQAWDKVSESPELEGVNQIADNTALANSYLAQIAASGGSTPKEVADSIATNYKEVIGEKGVSDTWYQRFGRHQENEDGNILTYNEKRAGLTKINTELNKAQSDLDVATKAYNAAKEKFGENSKEATEQEKYVNQAQSVVNELKYAQTHGGAGLTTAEQLLQGNADRFKYDKIGEKDFPGLAKLDTLLGKLNPEQINYQTVQSALKDSGMSKGSQNYVMGQYARQKMIDSGDISREDLSGYTNKQLGAALNASNLNSFVKAVEKASISGNALTALERQYSNKTQIPIDKIKAAIKEGSKEGSEEGSKKGSEEGSKKDSKEKTDTSKLSEKQQAVQDLYKKQDIKYGNVDPTTEARMIGLKTKEGIATVLSQTFGYGEFGVQGPSKNKWFNMSSLEEQNGKLVQLTQSQLEGYISNTFAKINQAGEKVTAETFAKYDAKENGGKGLYMGTEKTKEAALEAADLIHKLEETKISPNLDLGEISKKLEDLKVDIIGNINIQSISLGGLGGLASGQNNHRFGTFARGSRHGYTIPGRPTLTGEEGEELVWEPKRNQAYMVGTNGPQFANISKDAVVWNAAQTKKIKKNSGSAYFGTGAKGIRNFGTMAGGGPGGGSTHVNGQVELDAIANITEIKESSSKLEVPVTARIEETTGGGLLNQIKSIFGFKTTTTIPVTAKIENITQPQQKVPVGAIAKVESVTKSGTISGEPISVKANATVNSVTNSSKAEGSIKKTASAASSTQTMVVNANTTPAMSRINSIISVIQQPRTIPVHLSASHLTVTVTPNFQGTWEKTVKINKKPATGMNYKKYNSYAKGKSYIQNSNGHGGLALTGEEGYEVVWFPSQNKSMVVGMNGPQMMDLPSDAVVWPHEQSKKILTNNKGISIKSFSGGNTDWYPRNKGGASSSQTGRKKTSGGSKKENKNSKSNKKIAQAVGSIDRREVEIYNLTKNIEKISHNIEKNSESIKTKLDKTIDFSYSQISSLVGEQTNALEDLISKNTSLSGKYAEQEKDLDSGSGKYKKYEISYDKKVKSTTGKGKNKKTKTTIKSTKAKVNLGKYITTGPNGEYVIDYAAINSVATNKKQGKKMANAILEAAKKEIDDLTSKQLAAEKAAEDARKKLEELRKELQDTLFGWENELTEIKNLENQLALSKSYSGAVENLQELIAKTVEPSLSNLTSVAQDYQRAVYASVQATKEQINAQQELREAYISELQLDLSLEDEYKELTLAKNERSKATAKGEQEKLDAKIAQIEDDIDSAQVGKRFVSTSVNEYGRIQVGFDWEGFEEERKRGDVNNTEYEAVKKYYEKIVEDVEKINDTNSEIANQISSLYDQRNDQYQMMSDYTQKIRQGMEEEEQKTIDELGDLNNSIQNAFNDLIDKVKKELDRQRKIEENKKTEQDISDKMNRLAMLRADTSGSNAVEIAQLEKEIADDTGNYEDSLEDQLLDNLQEQADEAAKQREKQIELLSAQLEYSKTAGLYLANAENLVQKIADGTATNEEIKTAQLYYLSSDELLDKWGKKLESINFASETVKVESFNSSIEKFEQAIEEYKQATQDLINNTFDTDKQVQSRTLKQIQEDITKNKGNINIKDAYDQLINEAGMDEPQALQFLKTAGYSAKDFKSGGFNASQAKTAGFAAKDAAGAYSGQELRSGGYSASELRNQAGYNQSSLGAAGYSYAEAKSAGYSASQLQGVSQYAASAIAEINRTNYDNTMAAVKKKKPGKVTVADVNNLISLGSKTGFGPRSVLEHLVGGYGGSDPFTWKNIFPAIINTSAVSRYNLVKTYPNGNGTLEQALATLGNPNTLKEIKKKTQYKNATALKYATGGLADYTGPAWMDGTPSKPELVLNATDTKNFLALKDTLSNASKHGIFNNEELNSGGDINLDIDINVDKIDSDYDVDQIANRVKKIIVKEAQHRNVTVTGRLR